VGRLWYTSNKLLGSGWQRLPVGRAVAHAVGEEVAFLGVAVRVALAVDDLEPVREARIIAALVVDLARSMGVVEHATLGGTERHSNGEAGVVDKDSRSTRAALVWILLESERERERESERAVDLIVQRRRAYLPRDHELDRWWVRQLGTKKVSADSDRVLLDGRSIAEVDHPQMRGRRLGDGDGRVRAIVVADRLLGHLDFLSEVHVRDANLLLCRSVHR